MPVPVAETGYARDPMDAAVSVASTDAPASTDWWAAMAAKRAATHTTRYTPNSAVSTYPTADTSIGVSGRAGGNGGVGGGGGGGGGDGDGVGAHGEQQLGALEVAVLAGEN